LPAKHLHRGARTETPVADVGHWAGASVARYPELPYCHFRGILYAMKATIDAAGRIVVPKSLRQALGLKPGQLLELRAGDGRLEIEIVPTPVTLKKRGKGVVAVPDTELPTLTAEQVRDTLERVRR
jgi:AbrB family looped-hinge helix DNA binding protein